MDSDGKLVYQRLPAYYKPDILFATVCYQCNTTIIKEDVFITLYDSWGDGWNNNQFAFTSNQQVLGTFTPNFTSGHYFDHAIAISVPKGVDIKVIPYVMGFFRQEVSFTVRDKYGQVVFSHPGGVLYSATDVLGTFCLQCKNLLSVRQTSAEASDPEYAARK